MTTRKKTPESTKQAPSVVIVSSAMVSRAEEYVETFCSLTDNTCGETATRFHAAVLLAEMKRLRLRG